MVTTLAKSPVPVRLSLRYSNGMVVSHNTRALSYDENSLRVLSNCGFEKGTTLTVLAPFFEGITTGWVFGIARSQEQPGYYELVLQLDKKPVSAPATAAVQPKQPNLPPSDAMQEATEKLIAGLYRVPPPRFSRVLEEIPPELRPASLVISVTAVIFLLQTKGHVNLSRLVQDVREATKK